jgi:hypothetical protein
MPLFVSVDPGDKTLYEFKTSKCQLPGEQMAGLLLRIDAVAALIKKAASPHKLDMNAVKGIIAQSDDGTLDLDGVTAALKDLIAGPRDDVMEGRLRDLNARLSAVYRLAFSGEISYWPTMIGFTRITGRFEDGSSNFDEVMTSLQYLIEGRLDDIPLREGSRTASDE